MARSLNKKVSEDLVFLWEIKFILLTQFFSMYFSGYLILSLSVHYSDNIETIDTILVFI